MKSSTDERMKIETAKVAWFLVDPRRHPNLMYWDIAIALCLVYTALITPFEVGFLETHADVLFCINRVIDSFFFLDMVLQFVLIADPRSSGLTAASGFLSSETEHDYNSPRAVAMRYLQGWFLLDLVSLLASIPDIIQVTMEAIEGDTGDASKMGKMKVLRVLRVIRLIKLLRLLRASRMMARWETRVAVNYALVSLLSSVFTTILVAHWMACVWALQAFIVDDPVDSWLGVERRDGYAYCRPLSLPHPPAEGDASDNVECAAPSLLYAASLYWSIMTLVSVGYGDISASPRNVVELWAANLMMLVSGLVWAHTVGNFCGIVATLEPEKAQFRTLMDRLNRYMSVENLPTAMRWRLREYFHHGKIIRQAEAQKELLGHMSPALRGVVAWQCLGPWLSRVHFLKQAQREFLVEIAVNLHCIVFAPGDLTPSGFLYIVYDGIVLYRGRLLVKGGTWGEDMVLQSTWLIDSKPAKATNFVATFYIDRVGLISVAERYPRSLQAIRRFAIRLAVRREFIMRAGVKRLQQREEERQQLSAASSDRANPAPVEREKSCIDSMLEEAGDDASDQIQLATLGTGIGQFGAATLARTVRAVAEQDEKLGELADVVTAIALKLGAVERSGFDKIGRPRYKIVPPGADDAEAGSDDVSPAMAAELLAESFSKPKHMPERRSGHSTLDQVLEA